MFKKLIAITFALLLVAFTGVGAWAGGENIRTFTFKAYDATTAYTDYNDVAGVTTMEGGVSDMTWTADGQYPNTSDFRTIDLNKYCPNPKMFIFQLSGVSLSRSLVIDEDEGTSVGSSSVTWFMGLSFSDTDTEEAWSAVSRYDVGSRGDINSAGSGSTPFRMGSGGTLFRTVLDPGYDIEFYGGTASVSGVGIAIAKQLPIARYMRAYWISGATQFRNPVFNITVVSE